jgi:DNA-binding NarL/FixJ family response regulator
MYKISIIESQPIIREGLKALLRKQLGFDTVSSYSDFIELLRDTESLQPDIVFLGLHNCDANEFELIGKIKKHFAHVKILVISANNHEDCIKCTFRAGAHGYLLRNATSYQLCKAVNCVTQGQFYLSSSILTTVINCFMYGEKQTHSKDSQNLTVRERELLKLISTGYKNKEIANSLCLSVKTIEAHRSNLMKKLNVHNIASLTTKANQLGVAL